MKPDFSNEDAVQLAATVFGLEARATGLASYSDQNFRIDCTDGRQFVLKIANAGEIEAELDFQQQALQFLSRQNPALSVPRLYATTAGRGFERVRSATSSGLHLAWMVSYLPGTFAADLDEREPHFLYCLGYFLGSLDRSLNSFRHPAMDRKLDWDLMQIGRQRAHLPYLSSANKRSLAEHYLDRFDRCVSPRLASMRASVIHNDANDHNIIVSRLEDRWQVAGLIDFGDMVYTRTICEPAIAIAYMILGEQAILEIACQVLKGYHAACPIPGEEAGVLFDLIGARLCMSVCMSARERSKDPGNAYLAVSEQPAWEALGRLADLDPNVADRAFREVLAFTC